MMKAPGWECGDINDISVDVPRPKEMIKSPKRTDAELARISGVLASVRCRTMGLVRVPFLLKQYFGDDPEGVGFQLLHDWMTETPLVDEDSQSDRDEVLNGNKNEREGPLTDDLKTVWKNGLLDASPISLEKLLASLASLRDDEKTGVGSTIAWTHLNLLTGRYEPDPKSHLDISIAIRHLAVSLYRNTFNRRHYVDGLDGHVELDTAALKTLWLRVKEVGMATSKDLFDICALQLAGQNERHPVLEELRSYDPWDGTNRIDELFSYYADAGADGRYSELFRWAGRAFMIAMVRRLRSPGTKFDIMPVLEGPQGAGKSTFLKVLGGDWFEDGLQLGADPKIVIEQTNGKWVVEISELSGMSGREIENVKAMVSRTHDTSREAYKEFSATVPRQFVMAGTTNDRRYLKDSTGNRRFLPIEVGRMRLDELQADREQLFAEALVAEAARDEKGNIESIAMRPDLYALAAELQESRTITSPIFDRLQEIIGDQSGTIDIPTIRRILGDFNGQDDVLDKWDDRMAQQTGRAMAKLGYRHKKRRTGADGCREVVYVKEGADGEAPDLVFTRPNHLEPRQWGDRHVAPPQKVVKLSARRLLPADGPG